MVLWPWILFRHGTMTDRLFRHELQHVYQIKRFGIVGFYVTYLLLWVLYLPLIIGRRSNNEHPLEKEAKEREGEPLTEQELKWLNTNEVSL